MNLANLLNWTYLIERYPVAGFSWPFRIILLVIFIGSILAALLALNKLNNKIPPKPFWLRLQTWGWATGIIGLILMIFRETRAIYLASRLWLLLWLLIVFIWLGYLIYFKLKVLPRMKKHEAVDQETYGKYLPHKKS